LSVGFAEVEGVFERRIDMRIAYINTDEVNQAVAAQMAGKFGAVVCDLHPKDPPPNGKYDAVLHNLDDVPRHRRRDVLAEILRGLSTCPTAIHCYDLSEDLAASLRQHGVSVAQRLHLDLFRILCRTVLQNLANVPVGDASVEETWIDLAE
jgi:hypothetical protein